MVQNNRAKNNFTKPENVKNAAFKLMVVYWNNPKAQYFYSYAGRNDEAAKQGLIKRCFTANFSLIKSAILYDNQSGKEIEQLKKFGE